MHHSTMIIIVSEEGERERPTETKTKKNANEYPVGEERGDSGTTTAKTMMESRSSLSLYIVIKYC